MKTNQPTKKEAVFLMGPPAAGKSTTRLKLFPELPVIDPDEIKKSLPGYDPKNPSRVHLQSKVIARKQFEELLLRLRHDRRKRGADAPRDGGSAGKRLHHHHPPGYLPPGGMPPAQPPTGKNRTG